MTETILICEALGQSLVREPFITAAVVAPKLTERRTAAAVRSAQLRAIGEGSVRIALACDETILDFDPARLLTGAEEHGGALRISGAKELVIDGTTATHFVVTAQHAGRGPNAFHVAPASPGLRSRRCADSMEDGSRASRSTRSRSKSRCSKTKEA